VAALIHRRKDPTPKTQHSEDEESNPVRAFATLRRLGLCLVAVSDENPAPSVVRVPQTPAHDRNPNGGVPVYGSQKTPLGSIRAEARLRTHQPQGRVWVRQIDSPHRRGDVCDDKIGAGTIEGVGTRHQEVCRNDRCGTESWSPD
jgi:hypothetical protein